MAKIRSQLLIFVCLLPLMAEAGLPSVSTQDSSAQVQAICFWLSFGGGWSWIPEGIVNGEINSVPAGGAGLYYQDGSNLFSLRAVGMQNVSIGLGAGDYETVWDVGVLYGLCARASYGSASVSAGIGIAGDSKQSRLVPGIPLESQLTWTLSPHLGVCLVAFADLNKERSFAGGLLCLQLGSLR